jgi:hypothetical protein
VKFRRREARREGWPKYEAYNLGMKPTSSWRLRYAYDGGTQVARTAVPLSERNIESGKKSTGHRDREHGRAPGTAAAFEVCFDSISSATTRPPTTARAAPEKKAKGK